MINIDIKALLLRYENKEISGLFVTEANYKLSDQEVREYLNWCLTNGYKNLKDAPSFEEYKKAII